MIRLLTGAPRRSGVGTYVAHLHQALDGKLEIYYRRSMDLVQYTAAVGRESMVADALFWLKTKSRLKPEAFRTHVGGEVFGAVFGDATRLVSVHHVVSPARLRTVGMTTHEWIRRRLASRGCSELARYGVEVTTPSRAAASEFTRVFRADPARVTTVPHAIDTKHFTPGPRADARAKLSIPSDSRVVLHLSTDDVRKNVSGVVRIWSQVSQTIPGSMLVHIGPSAVLARVYGRGGNKTVRLIDRVSDEELLCYYRAADLLLHPSLQEGFGRPVLESLSVGTPAVTSDLPVFQEELGRFFVGADPNDWIGFRAVLLDLLSGNRQFSPDDLRQHVVQEFGLETFKRRYLELYRSVGLS